MAKQKKVVNGKTQLSVWVNVNTYWACESWRATNHITELQEAVDILLSHALTNPPTPPEKQTS